MCSCNPGYTLNNDGLTCDGNSFLITLDFYIVDLISIGLTLLNIYNQNTHNG